MKTLRKPITISGSGWTVATAKKIAEGAALSFDDEAKTRIEQSRKWLEQKTLDGQMIYGVNTGFGSLAKQSIPKENQKELQKNLLRSHAAGAGAPLSLPETRLAMALRLHVFAKGQSGVRYKLCEKLLQLLEKEVLPVIPEQGSVGASGDLAPLAHLALPIIGEGEVHYKGNIIPAQEALAKEAISPLNLEEKEGLSLVNGTQVMLAVGALALVIGRSLLALADLIAALSYEALEASLQPLDSLIHLSRGHLGQMRSAEIMIQSLEGSYLHTLKEHPRVQDPYSLRCAPQVHGASRDAIDYATSTVETELNASTDNPLVFTEQEKILNGGNFHGQPIAFAFDIASMAFSELGNISERRLELLVNPAMSGLPAFLTKNEGLSSGYMALQYLSASLVNENKILASPAVTDSIPGNAGVEDHVSMGMTSAKKLRTIVQNTKTILAAELLAAAQAIHLKGDPSLGQKTKELYLALRKTVPPLNEDRIVAIDVKKAVDVLKNFQTDETSI